MATERTFASLFVGTAEQEQAATLVGWIAIAHARVEQALDYLLWQLEAFGQAQRASFKAMDRAGQWQRLRELRADKRGRTIEQELDQILAILHGKRIVARLNEQSATECVHAKWATLSSEIMRLKDCRNNIVHSIVAWSDKLVRTRGGPFDGETEALDLQRDEKVREELGSLATTLGEFTTELDGLLPFPGPDRIITATTTVQLPLMPRR